MGIMKWNIKLTPLVLFLMILFVLIISVLMSKMWSNSKLSEGFLSFKQSTSSLTNVTIPQYSATRNVTKLYDNIFFDQETGNVIRAYSPTYNNSNLDDTGSSITSIAVLPRLGNGINCSTTKDSNNKINACSIPNINTAVSSQYTNSWVNPDANAFRIDTTSVNQIIYMPWGYNTVIQMFDISNHLLEGTFLFKSGNIAFSNTATTTIPIPTTIYSADSNATLNDYTLIPLYDSSNSPVYRISDFVLFDLANGNLIVQTSAGINIYPGNATAIPRTTGMGTYQPTQSRVSGRLVNTAPNLASFYVSDAQGSNIVLYVPDGPNTMVAVFKLDPNNNKLLALRNVVRFTPNGLDNGGSRNGGSHSRDDEHDYDDVRDHDRHGRYHDDDRRVQSTTPPSLDSVISNYYSRYWGQNATLNGGTNQYSNDFMLKTQIVPPICPACPNCPSTTTCTNCGGKGGAGTYGAGSGDGPSAGAVAERAIDTVGDVAGGALVGAGALAGGALLGAGAVAGGALHGVGEVGEGALNLGGSAINTVGNVAGSALRGAGEVGEGALNFGGSVVNTIGKLGQPMQQGQGQQTMQQGQSTSHSTSQGQSPSPYTQNYGGYGQPPQGNGNFAPVAPGTTDNYSYYGALSSKGGNPVPVTADFSRFGR